MINFLDQRKEKKITNHIRAEVVSPPLAREHAATPLPHAYIHEESVPLDEVVYPELQELQACPSNAYPDWLQTNIVSD